jgi:hypothetical protein
VQLGLWVDTLFGKQTDGVNVGEHRPHFGRGETIYDTWHNVPSPRNDRPCANL